MQYLKEEDQLQTPTRKEKAAQLSILLTL